MGSQGSGRDPVQEVNLGEVVNAEDPVKEVILVVMKIPL